MLDWSERLRDYCELDDDQATEVGDDQAAEGDEPRGVVDIAPSLFYALASRNLQGYLLERAESGDAQQVIDLVAALGFSTSGIWPAPP
jgi:hypothetical protein